jgi:Peptidase family M1 domain/Carboxypeptidase regulatory-like domain
MLLRTSCTIRYRLAEVRHKHFSGVLKTTFFFLWLMAPTWLPAQTISGTIQDPSGAVIAAARIEITGGGLAQPAVLSSDGQGKFSSPELKPGTYSLRVTRDGFEPLTRTVDLKGAVQLQLTLAIAQQQVSITVPGKNLAFANSDPFYRQLREIGLGQTYRVDNYTLNWDVGTFQFQHGTLTVLNPVDGVETGAIFIGEGHFSLKPVLHLDARELERRTGSAEASEDFTEVVFRFTREAWAKFLPGVGEQIGTPPEAAVVFKRWRERMRERRERPIGLTQYLLQGETMDNVDADLMAAFYNPSHPEFLNAYFHGKKHHDLRFFVRNRVGALPQLDSPEEVALINYDPEGMDDGVWYLAHLKAEYLNHTASSSEDRRLFATVHYKIETVISKNEHLFSTATITFKPLIPGERVLKFGLLPNLRVTRVADDQGQGLYWIQESRKEDGSFYAILPQAPEAGKEKSITIEYTGDKVLEQAGDGSFYVSARSSWYPNLNGFGERALYDLTYKVPHRYKVISVGRLQAESTEEDFAVSHWVTPSPVAVAGFNYGDYKRTDLVDEKTGYKISGYYLTELPDSLRRYSILRSMAPNSMTKYALEQTRAQLQLCSYYFGKSPYEDIYITEQPNFNFGQSWPNLVYLPISAYMDSTQRWMLFGGINNKFTGFVQEVTPHEVAHQWWGHAVGWASYHDQWLSEGFAEFSAGLFLQQAMGKDWRKDYIEFWERLRLRALEKNNYGVAPNDAGPIWMGLRLISPRSENAYQNVTYPKGAFILGMLRSMMYSPDDQDKEFIAMMHDFVESHRDRPASTETFKVIAEKHMTKLMDFEKTHRLDWFFNEWVYGTQVPRYEFHYQVSPAQSGKVNLHMIITQSEVDDHFAMLVPVFADFGTGMVPIVQIGIGGNTTRNIDIILPAQPKKVALNAYKEILER